MNNKLFITGTDTEVGKTFFTVALIEALQRRGRKVVGFKPVAAGAEESQNGPMNEDATAIIDVLNVKMDYTVVNPFCLQAAIAPHIAAKNEGVELSVKLLNKAISLPTNDVDDVIIEGAGGWLVPLNESETLADYAQSQNCDVILVVGLKLGCINHSLLTQAAIAAMGLNLVGWVANHVCPQMEAQQDNINTLKSLIKAPLLAEFPWFDDKLDAQPWSYVNITPLL